MEDDNKPVDTLRDGRVKASIWEKETDKGPFHSVTFARTYRDQDGNYADAHSFSGTDLLKVSRLAERSYDQVQDLQRTQAQEQTQAAPAPEQPAQEQPQEPQPQAQSYAEQQRQDAQSAPQPQQDIER